MCGQSRRRKINENAAAGKQMEFYLLARAIFYN